MSSAPLRTGAVVLAGGSGTRFGGVVPKQFRDLGGRPVAVRSVESVLAHAAVERVVLVLPSRGFARWRDLVAPHLSENAAPVTFTAGGATRQESSMRGLDALDAAFAARDGAPPELVLVHDAARPGAPADLLERVVASAGTHGAAIPALRSPDTLWSLASDGAVDHIVDRDRTAGAQTPQGFRRDLLRRSLRQAAAEGFSGSDEAAAVRRTGHAVRVVRGSPRNLKVTTADDLALLEGLYPAPTSQERGAGFPRVGHGFDAHRYGNRGVLRLGGVEFPGTAALEGHSDGDALLHALTDAVLGAVAGPDIGSLFPSSDPALAGADSGEFLRRASGIAREAGFRPGQVDLTVVAERPRLAPRRAEVRRSVAALLGLPEDAVGLKATTTDGMGFTGRGEGLAATAIVRLDPVGGDEG